MIADDPFLDAWHRMVAERDIDTLGKLLAEDVTISPPPYWQRLEGHALVHHLLGLILHTIEDFRYHREWRDGRELALEFRGRVGDHEVQGMDLITLNEAGVVQNLDVLIRPHDAVAALIDAIRPKMLAHLAKAGGGE
jgi:hypothetical protein